ncbi:phosphatidylglycerol lysyltransferase [Poseidonocella pacifica]|uniref:Phosphatidylglycerol lysyltransferase n=1 Tax=Poseidonocella pacifica TaxID=871651 RepID=A0A1I0VD51_9RHOB|nr:phosphatidylglycerol lysyltransferase domain-containing protein [Poseidonocella pacifica]SFA74359.1 phosphatidylglycerol lysyltransferase [Poseidonocella pacifica]
MVRSESDAPVWRKTGRICLPIALGTVAVWLLHDRLKDLDMVGLRTALMQTPAEAWLCAALATALSFWAIAGYERVLHRHLGTAITPARAGRSGAAAVALAQLLGAGVATGTIARWRLVPELSLKQATAVTLLLTISFMTLLAVLCGLALALLPSPAGIPRWIAPTAVVATIALFGFLLFAPELRLGGQRLRLPTAAAGLRLLGYAALDTAAAAFALWILLPEASAPAFLALYPIFLIAIGAALLSGVPGGVGPFELTLLAFLPGEDYALIAAILAFRALYYALPAIVAGAIMLRPKSGAKTEPSAARIPTPLLDTAPRSECGVARQGAASLLQSGDASAVLRHTRQASVLLFDPLDGKVSSLLPSLRAEARASDRIACLYKLSPRNAAVVRANGFSTLRIAQEALVDIASYDLGISARRGLRRKLRKAENAGVEIMADPGSLPLGEMRRLSDRWAERTGGERGFSMGRFCPAYIETQRVLLAWEGPRLIGFATFHMSSREWALDLMRLAPDAPDGTMHLLVHRAISLASDEGIPRLSLAAVPSLSEAVPAQLRARIDRAAGSAGLRQFKAAFAPRWVPLYAAAPGPLALALALFEIARSVRRPDALPSATKATPPHGEHEGFEFAPAHVS